MAGDVPQHAGFNPWFNGLMDKDMKAQLLNQTGKQVSTLGLMD